MYKSGLEDPTFIFGHVFFEALRDIGFEKTFEATHAKKLSYKALGQITSQNCRRSDDRISRKSVLNIFEKLGKYHDEYLTLEAKPQLKKTKD